VSDPARATPHRGRGRGHKLATTRLWLWLLLSSVALTALYASLAIAFGDTPDNPTPPLTSPGGQRTVFSVGQGAGTLLAVLAAIGLTGEFRHQTTTTFLATPTAAGSCWPS
jgi:ABC-2 type transport system permease protein